MGRKRNKKAKEEAKQMDTVPRAVEAKATSDFNLIIPRAVMDKIKWWMHKTNKEVSGFGSLNYDAQTKTFTVKDAILLKQEVTGASAEIDPNAMAKAMFQMKDDPMGLKWHWHSHVNMGVFWSGDDMDIIRSLGQRGWILASVFNYKEEMLTAYLTQTTVMTPDGKEEPHDVFVNNVPTKVINYVQQNMFEQWDKEFDENVKDYVYAPAKSYLASSEDKEASAKAVTHFRDRDDKGPLRYVANYTHFGYGQAYGFPGGPRQIYNPVFDTDLKTRAERVAMVDDLTTEEIEFLQHVSPAFKDILTDYYKMKAEETDAAFGTMPHNKKSADDNEFNELDDDVLPFC